MKKFLILFFVSASIFAQVDFQKYFSDKSLRFDFFHTGNNETEIFSFDKMMEEPYWGGSKTKLIDNLEYGNYFFKVIDSASGEAIYSRGFSTLFQEWQTTDEAKKVSKTFSGTVTFPFPKVPVVIELYRRNKKNIFVKKFSYEISPENYFIKKEQKEMLPDFKVHYSGESSSKLDIVFIPEGYSKAEMELFKSDCEKLSKTLFSYSPFKENENKINIWGIEAPSSESGTDIPGKEIWKNTLLNSNFYTFDSERYLMTSDYHKVRDIASNAPYDQIYILVNTEKYGGGAIYNFYSMTAAHNKYAGQVFVHEFGHGLAGLGDEYAADDTYNEFYPLDVEPWEPNLTTLVNFDSKWKNLIEEGVPVPTPVDEKYQNNIGVFEGGGYVKKGVYRPTINSIMNSFVSNEFNEVCKRAIINVISLYSE